MNQRLVLIGIAAAGFVATLVVAAWRVEPEHRSAVAPSQAARARAVHADAPVSLPAASPRATESASSDARAAQPAAEEEAGTTTEAASSQPPPPLPTYDQELAAQDRAREHSARAR
jgi:hypothetical protein